MIHRLSSLLRCIQRNYGHIRYVKLRFSAIALNKGISQLSTYFSEKVWNLWNTVLSLKRSKYLIFWSFRSQKQKDLSEFWPYGRLKGPKIQNEALKNNVLSSLCPMDRNPRRHEQIFLRCVSFVYSFLPILPCKINKRSLNILKIS